MFYALFGILSHFLQFYTLFPAISAKCFSYDGHTSAAKRCFKRCQTAIFPMHRTAEQGRST